MPDSSIDEIIRELSMWDFIVFAGTGVLGDTGIPKWKELLQNLLDVSDIRDIDINRIPENEYPDVAQRIYENLVSRDNEQLYYDKIKETLEPTNATYSGQQIEIWLTTNCIVTTNFEKTFLTAYQRTCERVNQNLSPPIPEINSLPDFERGEILDKPRIIYLHGLVNERCIVFRTDEYKNNYPSVSNKNNAPDDLEQYLKHLYRNYVLVFVGFSFSDWYFFQSLTNIHRKIKAGDEYYKNKVGYKPILPRIKHYAFLKNTNYANNDYLLSNIDTFNPDSKEYHQAKDLFDIVELDKELESINIEVFRYDKHRDWMDAFERIRSIKKTQKAELANE